MEITIVRNRTAFLDEIDASTDKKSSHLVAQKKKKGEKNDRKIMGRHLNRIELTHSMSSILYLEVHVIEMDVFKGNGF